MAWTGEVWRKMDWFKHNGQNAYTCGLECGHKCVVEYDPIVMWNASNSRHLICPVCSAPGIEKVKKTQQSIKFDDVLEKIKKLS